MSAKRLSNDTVINQFAASDEVDLIDEFDEPYTYRAPQKREDFSNMKTLEVPVPIVHSRTSQPHALPNSHRSPKDLAYMEILKVPTQQSVTNNDNNNNNHNHYNNLRTSHASLHPVTSHIDNYNNNVHNNRTSHENVHHALSNNFYNDSNRTNYNPRDPMHHQVIDFEVEILRILYRRSISNHNAFPVPNSSQFYVVVGDRTFNSLRYDYGISFIPFLSNLYNNFRESPSVNETNRCFFLHLAVGIGVHPFLLQSVFRSRSRTLLNNGRNNSNDFLALELLLQSVTNPADFVDANVLFHLWPEEFNTCRVCFISDTDRATIFTCFRNSTLNPVRDVVIHCDGSHFTLLVFDVSLDQILAAATASNNTVFMNEIPGSRYSMQREIENIIR